MSRNPLISAGYNRGSIQQESNHFKSNFTAYDKEKIFEDLLQHKERINILAEENYKIKTALVNKERELKKYEKVIEEIQQSGNLKSLNTKFSTEKLILINFLKTKQSFLYVNLKKQIKELQDEAKYKTEEINQMKRNQKYSRYLEIEVNLYPKLLPQEKKCFMDETIKMRGIIQTLQEQLQRAMYNSERMFQLENQQQINNNVITALRQSNSELEDQLKESRNQLKTNKEMIDKQNNKIRTLQNELNKQNKQNMDKEKQLVHIASKYTPPQTESAIQQKNKILQLSQPQRTSSPSSKNQKRPLAQQKGFVIDENLVQNIDEITYLSQLIKYGAISKNIPYQKLLQEFQISSKTITLLDLSAKLEKDPFQIKDQSQRQKMILFLTDNKRKSTDLVEVEFVKQKFMQIITEYQIQQISDSAVENEIQTILRSNQQELKNILESLFSPKELIDSLQKINVEMSKNGFDLLLLRCFEFSSGDLKNIPRNELLSYCGLKLVTFDSDDKHRRNSLNRPQQPPVDDKKKKLEDQKKQNDEEEKKRKEAEENQKKEDEEKKIRELEEKQRKDEDEKRKKQQLEDEQKRQDELARAKKQQEEEQRRKKQLEEEDKKRQEEANRNKKQQEEEERQKKQQQEDQKKRKEEEERRKQQLEETRKKQEEEEQKKKQQEEQELLKKQKEEEEQAAKFIQQKYRNRGQTKNPPNQTPQQRPEEQMNQQKGQLQKNQSPPKFIGGKLTQHDNKKDENKTVSPQKKKTGQKDDDLDQYNQENEFEIEDNIIQEEIRQNPNEKKIYKNPEDQLNQQKKQKQNVNQNEEDPISDYDL